MCVCTQAVNLQLRPVSMDDDSAHRNTQPQEPHNGKVHPDPEAPPAPSCEPAHAEKAEPEEPVMQSASCCMVLAFFKAFVRKMSGGLGKPPPVPPPVDWFLASIGSLCVPSFQSMLAQKTQSYRALCCRPLSRAGVRCLLITTGSLCACSCMSCLYGERQCYQASFLQPVAAWPDRTWICEPLSLLPLH